MTPDALRAWMRERNYTAQALADDLGVGLRTVRRWLSGDSDPPAYLTRALRDLDRERQETLG
ncbi:MAG: helix-turn-helix domain-containing protein [Gemmatimonadaceae bacterium]|nr:helix-turn-helix domain-containing protein [Gemmatimonadaceae bacterium]